MSPARTAPRRRLALVAGATVSIAALLAGCSGSGGSTSGSHDSINYALPANFKPNWILPIGTAAHLNTNNNSISASLWEPLISYDGSTGRIGWNKKASVATDADFADDRKSVTITLGDRHWSDGKPITSRDVEFWFHLIKANKKAWAGYNPGKAPDNWTSFKTIDDRHFKITFDKAYNTQWMLADQLSSIRPLPQHVWDKTSDAAKISDADRSSGGAKKVWAYLLSAAKKISGLRLRPVVEDPQRPLLGQVLLHRRQGGAGRQHQVRRRREGARSPR